MVVAGIMTGTSLDAIDVAMCEIQQQGDRHSITLLSFHTEELPEELRSVITRSIDGTCTTAELAQLPFNLATAYAHAYTVAADCLGPKYNIEAIGAHGQTIWHDPPQSTWQVLSGSALAALTSKRVVHDFRSADVAIGGQGAPLVPLFDVATIASGTTDRVALNIGGMANITLLPREKFNGGSPDPNANILAFDTGPGNVMIDAAAQRFFGKKYDNNGTIARAGVVVQPMLEGLLALPYFALDPPKSTGREMFNEQLLMDIAERYRVSLRPSEDVVTTITELTARSITDQIHKHQPTTTEVVISGGGVKNSFLMERISLLLPNASVISSSNIGIPPQAKEAMAFAYFAWRTLNEQPSNMPSVTGAERAVVLGSVSFA